MTIVRAKMLLAGSLTLIAATTFIHSNPAAASDLCQLGASEAERVKPYFYQDFYTGWAAFKYSVDEIQKSIATNQDANLATHLRRICPVAEGLKRFALQINVGERPNFTAALNQAQGVVGALEDVRVAKDVAKGAPLVRQLSSISDSVEKIIPPCWRSISSTLHGRNQTSCR